MPGVLTIAGETKLAGSVGGAALNLTTIRIGDGNGAAIVPLRTMTDLVRRVGVALPITASARDATTPTMWRVTTEIPAGSGPFTLREIAVFDAAGDMIAIASHPAVEFLGPGGDAVSIITDIVFPVSGNANVTVNITPTVMTPLHRNTVPYFMSVNSGALTAPPVNPAVGDTYAIPAAPTGAWAGMAGNLVQWWDGAWQATVPPLHHIVANRAAAIGDALAFLRREAGGWVSAAASTLAYGVTRLATLAEAKEGTRADIALTPAGLAEANASKTLIVNQSANQTIVSGSFNTLIWGAVAATSEYVTMNTSNGLATFVRPGTYLIELAVPFTAPGGITSGQLAIEIKKNLAGSAGSFSKRVFDGAVSTAFQTQGIAAIRFATNDTVEIQLFVSGGATVHNPSSVRNFLNITRIGD